MPHRLAQRSGGQFAHISRRVDQALGATVATLHPGDYYVAEQGEWIGTVLGSCVSACIRDSRLKIGGMNHFMLPMESPDRQGDWGASASAATRYGNVAMERLINEILKRGGSRQTLEIKLVGGGKVLDAMTDVGSRNIHFVRDYVRAEGFRVVGEDLGDLFPRKVLYDPTTGNARVKKLARTADSHVVIDEKRYMQKIDHTAVSGEIELF
ncbi:MAG: chemoreceptor glutamine deamidase CheD [Steroidobacteraceae bacterium]